MKKLFFIISLGTLLCLSALAAMEITIDSVTGTVKYEISKGVWETLTKDSVITGETVINTGLNSTLVLIMDGETISISAMQRGLVKELSEKALARKKGISLGGTIKEGTLNTETGLNRTNISTASTRASEAKEDLEWAEEEEEAEPEE